MHWHHYYYPVKEDRPSPPWPSSLDTSASLVLNRHYTEKNTNIFEEVNDIKRLKMTEVALIYLEKITINIQQQPEISLPSKRSLPGRSHAISWLALIAPHSMHPPLVVLRGVTCPVSSETNRVLLSGHHQVINHFLSYSLSSSLVIFFSVISFPTEDYPCCPPLWSTFGVSTL